MYNFTFEGHGTNTYLVYEIKPQDAVDSMSLGMLTNNKISGLANTIFTQMDSTKYIKYNVSSKVSAKQFFSGAVNKKRLLGVFSGIVKGLLSSEEYMIDSKSIILDLEYIFVDVTSCEAVLICLPIDNSREERIDAATFFKNIMFTTQFDQTENCDHVAKIMNFLNSMPIFSLTEFKKLMDELEQDDVKQVTTTSIQQPRVVSPQVVQSSHVVPQVRTVVTPPPQMQAYQQEPQPQVYHQHQQPQAQVPQPQPNMATPQVVYPADTSVSAQGGKEEKMSMFTLLTHYSKENAAIYKEQKAVAKENKGTSASKKKADKKAADKKVKETKKNSQKAKSPAKAAQPQFAIPGQSEEMAIPKPAQPVQSPAPTTTPVPKPAPIPQYVPVQPVPQSQHTAPQATPQAVPQPVPVQPTFAQPASKPAPMSFGETTVLGGGGIGETTVLNAGMQQNNVAIPHLIRQKNNEKIMINKPVYRIGKERSYVDYFISDNTAISRSHANIIIQEGQYFVEDTNSTNHTFVDGNIIQSSVKVRIDHGTKIRLANEEFEFRLY